tara:strand:+ start:27 stop:947 length:921 start_codon:yes stop_codon:yes gene_type:complete
MSNRKPIPKTQEEISNSLVEPYDKERGNPNSINTRNQNRALQISQKGDAGKTLGVTLQDHDEALLYYLNEVIKPQVVQNGELIDVPTMFSSPEKWKSYQKDGYLRDVKGAIMAPLLLFKRDSITKNRSLANKLDANLPHNYVVSAQKYSSRNAYSNFDVLNNRRPQKEYHAIVAPDYMTLTYKFVLYTYYVEQQNKIVEALQYASDAYWGNPEKFKFKATISQFGFQTELTADKERIVRSTFEVQLNGYLVPKTRQNDLNSIKKFSAASKVSFNVETTTDGVVDAPAAIELPQETSFSSAFSKAFK